MRPIRHASLAETAPLDGRGRRSPQTLLAIEERDALLREARARFCGNMSANAAAKYLHDRLGRYHQGRWRRDRIELTCPERHVGKLEAFLWATLKVRDSVLPSARLIRLVLSRPPAFPCQRDLVGFHHPRWRRAP